jgi:hypothetical protein
VASTLQDLGLEEHEQIVARKRTPVRERGASLGRRIGEGEQSDVKEQR